MAEPRRIQLSSVPASATFQPNTPKKPRLEEPEPETPVATTVRITLSLFEPDQKKCPEFIYPELVRNNVQGVGKKIIPPVENKKPFSPFDDEEAERKEVEILAKKFEEKYANKKKRRDRMQDLIDMGYGYDESDSFIDNSEAYDELVPASLTTKYGGFYINSGTLQFRQASESEDESMKEKKKKSPKKIKEKVDKLKKKKREEEKKARKSKHPKLGFSPLNGAKDKKKKKPDLSEMLARFQREKEAEKSKCLVTSVTIVPKPSSSASSAATLPPPPLPREAEPAPDPILSAILSDADLLQAASAIDSLTEKDLECLFDIPPPEKGGCISVITPTEEGIRKTPPMPNGLPPSLEKRIKELTKAVRLSEGDKKTILFTQEMNAALLDIYLLSRELSSGLRSTVFSHLSSVLPCSKDTLVKWASRLYLHKQQGGRLREPLRKLKEAIAKEMPEQINKYNEDFKVYNEAKHAKMLADVEQKVLSEEEEEEEDKSSKKAVGPRKKFQWTEEIRQLLGQLVCMKVEMYEPESSGGMLSLEEYFKSFLDVEVKPLWPRGWMQARTLFNESRRLYPQLSSIMSKNKSTAPSKVKLKASANKAEKTASSSPGVIQGATLLAKNGSVPPVVLPSAVASPVPSYNQDNSLDEDLIHNPPSLDAVSEHLNALSSRASIIAFDFQTPKPSVLERPVEEKKKISPMISVAANSHPSPRPPTFERPTLSLEKKPQAQSVIARTVSEIQQKLQQQQAAKLVKMPQVTSTTLQPSVKLFQVNTPQHNKGTFVAPSQSPGPKVSTPSPPQRPPTPQTKPPKQQQAFTSPPSTINNHLKPLISPGLLGKPSNNGGPVGPQTFRPPIPRHTVLPSGNSGNTSGPTSAPSVNQSPPTIARNPSVVPTKKPPHPGQKLTLMTPHDCGKGTQGVAKLLTSAIAAGKAAAQTNLTQSLKCSAGSSLIATSSSSPSSQSLTVLAPAYKPNGGKIPTATSLGLMSNIHTFPLHVIYTSEAAQKAGLSKDAIVTGPAPGTFNHGIARNLLCGLHHSTSVPHPALAGQTQPTQTDGAHIKTPVPPQRKL